MCRVGDGCALGVRRVPFSNCVANIESWACTQGLMGVGGPGLKLCGKGPAETGQGRVDCSRGGDEPESSHPPLVRAEY